MTDDDEESMIQKNNESIRYLNELDRLKHDKIKNHLQVKEDMTDLNGIDLSEHQNNGGVLPK